MSQPLPCLAIFDLARLLRAPHAHILASIAEIPAMLGAALAKE